MRTLPKDIIPGLGGWAKEFQLRADTAAAATQTILPQHCSTMEYAQMQNQSSAQNCSKQAKQVTSFTNLKVSTANVVADSRSEQTKRKNSDFLSWLQIAREVFRKDCLTSAGCHHTKRKQSFYIHQNSEKLRSTKIRSTQSYSRYTLHWPTHKRRLLFHSGTASTTIATTATTIRPPLRVCSGCSFFVLDARFGGSGCSAFWIRSHNRFFENPSGCGKVF